MSADIGHRTFSLGILALGVILFFAAALDDDRLAALDAERSLCVNGHPAPRSSHVTYGGLQTRACCERDHIVPLCLGGPDVLDNLQYQPWPQARLKDERERLACEAYCAGKVTLDEARSHFHREYPNQ